MKLLAPLQANLTFVIQKLIVKYLQIFLSAYI